MGKLYNIHFKNTTDAANLALRALDSSRLDLLAALLGAFHRELPNGCPVMGRIVPHRMIRDRGTP